MELGLTRSAYEHSGFESINKTESETETGIRSTQRVNVLGIRLFLMVNVFQALTAEEEGSLTYLGNRGT
jgi:hypothetical protein